MRLRMTADTLVEARWVIPVIPRNTVLENHTVVFSGGRIADILPTEAARVATRVSSEDDAPARSVVMPGLIDPICISAACSALLTARAWRLPPA